MDKTDTRYSTDELMSLIKNTNSLESALDNVSGELDDREFHEYLRDLMESSGISVSELIVRSLLSRSFVYQICSGQRKPGRDIVIRLAIVMKLSVEETQRMLKYAKKGGLYPRVRRDAVIIYCLENKLGLYETDETLCTLSEQQLLV